jgi:hypothetical protein
MSSTKQRNRNVLMHSTTAKFVPAETVSCLGVALAMFWYKKIRVKTRTSLCPILISDIRILHPSQLPITTKWHKLHHLVLFVSCLTCSSAIFTGQTFHALVVPSKNIAAYISTSIIKTTLYAAASDLWITPNGSLHKRDHITQGSYRTPFLSTNIQFSLFEFGGPFLVMHKHRYRRTFEGRP